MLQRSSLVVRLSLFYFALQHWLFVRFCCRRYVCLFLCVCERGFWRCFKRFMLCFCDEYFGVEHIPLSCNIFGEVFVGFCRRYLLYLVIVFVLYVYFLYRRFLLNLVSTVAVKMLNTFRHSVVANTFLPTLQILSLFSKCHILTINDKFINNIKVEQSSKKYLQKHLWSEKRGLLEFR